MLSFFQWLEARSDKPASSPVGQPYYTTHGPRLPPQPEPQPTAAPGFSLAVGHKIKTKRQEICDRFGASRYEGSKWMCPRGLVDQEFVGQELRTGRLLVGRIQSASDSAMRYRPCDDTGCGGPSTHLAYDKALLMDVRPANQREPVPFEQPPDDLSQAIA